MYTVFPAVALFISSRNAGERTARRQLAGVLLILMVGVALFSQTQTQSPRSADAHGHHYKTATRPLMPEAMAPDRDGLGVSATGAAVSAQPFLALRNLWDTVWSIDATAAELNEPNIMQALLLRARAERGDLEATVLLLGAAGWCASAGSLALQYDGVRGAPAACLSRFGPDIESRESLDWAIFRWTMQLSNAGFKEATLYASVLGREQLFAPLSSIAEPPDVAAARLETMETLRAQLIGQLQSMVADGSADAASELHSYYLSAIAHSRVRYAAAIGAEPDSVLARYYAVVTERLDPTRAGMIELTEAWILQHL